MLSEKRYNFVALSILAIISAYMFLSIFYLIILAINQYYNDMTFWALNSVTGVFLFLIFNFIRIDIEKKYYNHSLPKSSKIESKKKDKYDIFMDIGTYFSAFAVFAIAYLVILSPPEENVLSSTLI